jgi:sugar/nucleoside kinase (ribokinase family)
MAMSSAAETPIEILVVGEYFCDLIFSGLSEPPRLGADLFAEGLTVTPGGCYNMALALTRLRIPTAWASDFGTDLFSRLVLEQAEIDAIDPRAFNRIAGSLKRVSAAFSGAGERGFISYSENDVRPPDVGLLARLRPRWLLQSFRFDPDWLSFLRQAKASGIKIFSDCRHTDFTLSTPGVRELLTLSEVFSPNEAEALALTGRRDIEGALADLAEICPAIIIKRGPKGASALENGRRLDIAAPDVLVVDTVGAGDAFNAGFIAGVAWGSDFAECVKLAVFCGALSTTGAGNSAVPDAAKLVAYAARQRENTGAKPYQASASHVIS